MQLKLYGNKFHAVLSHEINGVEISKMGQVGNLFMLEWCWDRKLLFLLYCGWWMIKIEREKKAPEHGKLLISSYSSFFFFLGFVRAVVGVVSCWFLVSVLYFSKFSHKIFAFFLLIHFSVFLLNYVIAQQQYFQFLWVDQKEMRWKEIMRCEFQWALWA